MLPKVAEVIGIQDAMDNLATLAGINLDNPPPLGIIKKTRFIINQEEMEEGKAKWLSAEGADGIINLLDATYRAVHNYLDELYENPEMDWAGKRTRKGIAAMMALVGESAQKMNRYLSFRLGKEWNEKIEKRDDFKILQRFYVEKFSKKFTGEIEGERAWQEEWKENKEGTVLDTSGSGLKDFETVRADKEYELFYIRTEDGKPYFNYELLRNIKLTVDFETDGNSFEEDPLLKMRSMMDRDFQGSAIQILHECTHGIEDYWKIAKKFYQNGLASNIAMALTALYLTANPRNLLQNTIGKSCMQYFQDFISFLRLAMNSSEYQKLIAYPPDKKEKASYILLGLTHGLCRALFYRSGGVKQESIGMIFRTMRRGEEIAKKKSAPKGDTLWNQFAFDDEKFRTLLFQFPNGPLFKILDLIREEQDHDAMVPFDPFAQENLPCALYEIHTKGKKIDVLRIPCPTIQTYIHKAEIADEFRGFLRGANSEGGLKKHLVINLQNRTSWREYARCQALEQLQKTAEFNPQLFVMTLPKDTDFYHQSNDYASMNKAEEFLDACKDQIEEAESCGFSFPLNWKKSDILRFVESILPLIHSHFFHNKNTLTRRNREDFIEIFYQFLALKAIDQLDCDSLSFTCKDAVDTGAAAGAFFYGFIKSIHENLSKKQDQDFFRWLLYIPALFIRERAIDAERLNRTLSAMERLDSEMAAQGDKILKDISSLYKPQLLKNILVTQK